MIPTIGLEEEFFLIDDKLSPPFETRRSKIDALVEYLNEQHKEVCVIQRCPANPEEFGKIPEHFERELFSCIIELKTDYHWQLDRVWNSLTRLRNGLAQGALHHQFEVLASGSHPLADWRCYKMTGAKRTPHLQNLFGERFFVCGLHVHVGLDKTDREGLIWLLQIFRPLLPLFLALTASSPFWRGHNARMASCRSSIFASIPRGGLPPKLQRYREFDAYMEGLKTFAKPRSPKEPKELKQPQWLARPSIRFPTIEIRIMDACIKATDSMALAALIQTIALFAQSFRNPLLRLPGSVPVVGRRLGRRAHFIQLLQSQPDQLIDENLWRAARFGHDTEFIFSIPNDSGRTSSYTVKDLLDRIMTICDPEINQLGNRPWLDPIRDILEYGPCFKSQVDFYICHKRETQDTRKALQAVTRALIDRTMAELSMGDPQTATQTR